MSSELRPSGNRKGCGRVCNAECVLKICSKSKVRVAKDVSMYI